MKRPAISYGIAALTTFLAVVVFVRTLRSATTSPAQETDATAYTAATGQVPEVQAAETHPALAAKPVPPPSYYPARLDIPSIGVDANIQAVGKGTTGNMAVPTNFTDVAWYRLGPVPGSIGDAVIDGHVDNGLGLAAVFKYLSQVKPGDAIYVTDHAGTKVRFVVTSSQVYEYDQVPLAQIFGPASSTELTLITCDGVWIPGQKMYNERLVVTAVLATGA